MTSQVSLSHEIYCHKEEIGCHNSQTGEERDITSVTKS